MNVILMDAGDPQELQPQACVRRSSRRAKYMRIDIHSDAALFPADSAVSGAHYNIKKNPSFLTGPYTAYYAF